MQKSWLNFIRISVLAIFYGGSFYYYISWPTDIISNKSFDDSNRMVMIFFREVFFYFDISRLCPASHSLYLYLYLYLNLVRCQLYFQSFPDCAWLPTAAWWSTRPQYLLCRQVIGHDDDMMLMMMMVRMMVEVVVVVVGDLVSWYIMLNLNLIDEL